MKTTSISELLRQDILNGVFKAGDELKQVTLAERFGVSRIPVRDALQALSRERLVTSDPNRGARVVAFSKAEISEVYDLRIMLECHALAGSVAKANEEQIDEIEHAARLSMMEAGRDNCAAADLTFHNALYSASGMTLTIQLIGELRQICRVHVTNYDRLKSAAIHWNEQHFEMVACLKKADSKGAQKLLREHLGEARDTLLAMMK